MNAQDLPVRIRGQIAVSEQGCWLWTGHLQTHGYGQIRFAQQKWLVHRLAYTSLVGPIPAGLTIDHLCYHRPCCNPAHLETVTQAENARRAWARRRAAA